MNKEITQDELKYHLNYNETTGLFTWINPTNRRIKVGSVAGVLGNHGYINIMLNRKMRLAHRLVFLYIYGEYPPEEVDHIDHCKTNNRLDNLRQCSRRENGKNRAFYNNNTSGFAGVTYVKSNGRWKAQIGINGKRTYIGEYKTKLEAIFARWLAVENHDFHINHGET